MESEDYYEQFLASNKAESDSVWPVGVLGHAASMYRDELHHRLLKLYDAVTVRDWIMSFRHDNKKYNILCIYWHIGITPNYTSIKITRARGDVLSALDVIIKKYCAAIAAIACLLPLPIAEETILHVCALDEVIEVFHA